MDLNPLLSIIIPTYNNKAYLEILLQTIFMQTFQNFEILIIDDVSTDGTENLFKTKYLNHPKIRYFRNKKNSGSGIKGRKLGFQLAKGKFLIFCDHDDYYIDKTFFERALYVFQNFEAQGKELSLVFGNQVILQNGEKIYRSLSLKQTKNGPEGLMNRVEYLKGIYEIYEKPASTMTAIFRKKSLELAKFNEVIHVDDALIYFRALLQEDIYIFPEYVGVYRLHNNNQSFNIKIKFLLDDINEVKSTFLLIKERKLFEEAEFWLHRIIEYILEWYFASSPVSLEDFNTLRSWCESNAYGYEKEWRNYFKSKESKVEGKKVR